MKVFISWSGDRSKHIAETFQEWLRRVLQATEPWISTHIDKGLVWDNEISKNLNESRIGILCLTLDNLDSTYLHYEAGAISNVEGAIVCTFLFDIDSIDVRQPLSRFQNTKYIEADILLLLKTINLKLKENNETHLLEKDLEENFKLFYPLLQRELDKTPATNQPKPKRKDVDLLEEILTSIRSLQAINSPVLGLNVNRKNTFTIKGPIRNENEINLYNHIISFKRINNLTDNELKDHFSDITSYIIRNDPGISFSLESLERLLRDMAEIANIHS
jgi:hypothetical protein